jgi:DNA-binding SARP family transcriptional activator
MSGQTLTLFGTPSLRPVPGGAPSAPLGAKAMGLLAYLTLEPGPHSRKQLASLLWGESPDDHAQASLRQALRRLSAALGDAIRADRFTVEVVDPPECDAVRFRGLETADPQAAVAYAVPDFMADQVFAGASAFEDWVSRTRHALLQLWEANVRQVARDAVDRSRWRDALAAGEAWLRADHLNEEAMAVVLEALHCLGDRAGALSRFRHYREALRQELGARPTAALTNLADQIERSTPAAAGRATEAMPRFEADLQGRESQWLALLAAWDAARAGPGGAALILADAGMGKSRLADEFSRWASGRGATVLRAQGYEPASGAAFGPVATALATAINAPGAGATPPEWLAEVARLVPELRRRFPGVPEPAATATGERSRLFEGAAQMLMAVAAERPAIFLVDDLQWCDAESCAMLLYLVQRAAGHPVLFLLASSRGSRRRNAPADHLVRQLSARCHAAVVELGALSADDVWQVIRQLGKLRTPAGGRRFAHRIHQVSGGNPFYVMELLKTLFSQRLLTITPVSGEWAIPADISLDEFAALPMPRSVRDANEERISLLEEEPHIMLATLAVAAHPVTLDVLAHVHGMSRLRIAGIIDDLIERHLATEEDGGYRVAHTLLAGVVRSSVTEALRAELHRALSLSIEMVVPPAQLREAAGSIAWHASRAGESARAHDFALLACQHASGRAAYQEAFSWLGLAARAVPDDESALRAQAVELSRHAQWTEMPAFPPAGDVSFGLEAEGVDLRGALKAEG